MPILTFLRTNAAFLLAGVLLTFTSSYGQTYFISLFAGEIREAFGLSNGAWGGIYTVGTMISAAAMVWAGTLTDVFRVRALLLIVLPGLALACVAMSIVTGPVMLIFVVFALRFFGQGMSTQLSVVAMARWFEARRGTALSIASIGFSLGQAILPLVFVALLVSTDWRTLWLVAAGLVLIVIPMLLILLRLERTPQSIAEKAEFGGMNGLHWSRLDMLRHPLFWMIVPMIMGPASWGTALFFHQVHLTEVKGWLLTDWVALMPIFTITMIVSTFASGQAVDRFGAGRVVPVLMLPFAVGFAVLGLAQTIPQAGVGLVIFGIGQGMMPTVLGSFWAEFYGTRYLGAIKAGGTAIMVLGTAIGPGVTGVLIDWGISFAQQLVWLAIYFLAAGALATVGVARSRGSLTAPAEVDV